MKQCHKCKEIKPNEMFFRNQSNRDGLCSQCKTCMSQANRLWIQNNTDRVKETTRLYYVEHSHEIKKSARERYKRNAEKYREIRKTESVEKIEKRREMQRLWKLANPDKFHETCRRANTKRRSTIKGRLGHTISSGIYKSLHRNTKGNQHWETLVGYTVDRLKTHLEKQFTSGMTWENHGTIWEIDHKIPVAVFNYETPNDIDFKRCWALSNLRPLWLSENKKKSRKLDRPFQPALAINF